MLHLYFKGDWELEAVVNVICNRCFSCCVDSRSEGEYNHLICLYLNILSVFVNLEVKAFMCIKAHLPWPSPATQDSTILSCCCFSAIAVVCVLLHPCSIHDLQTFKDLRELQLCFILAILHISFRRFFLLPPVSEESQLAIACRSIVAAFSS